MKILGSATKLVLIFLTLAVIGGMFYGKVDAKDVIVLTSMVFAFYFKTSTTNQATE